jgi:hypothetical protein
MVRHAKQPTMQPKTPKANSDGNANPLMEKKPKTNDTIAPRLIDR